MMNQIPELPIIESASTANSNIFTSGDRYLIPPYQRPFAWEEEHIERLIEDIDDISDEGVQKYYLGTLIVSPHEDGFTYEVIDGQQRLTALYLLLHELGATLGESGQLGNPVPTPLSFSYRQRSDYTLTHLDILDSEEANEALVDSGIACGLKTVRQKLNAVCGNDGEREPDFLVKLAKTMLYRIEVPPYTDLNRYFEVMNTRGEQLEQHEVLKAWLMDALAETDRASFASIWDACSDMSCYVQMRFKPEARRALFGSKYDRFPVKESIEAAGWGTGAAADSLGIRDIINASSGARRVEATESIEPTRFNSIIDFDYFLLHVLRVFVHINGVKRESFKESDASVPLDDKKLKDTFERMVGHGIQSGMWEDRGEFANAFAACLLQTRFLFDKCIIKREYAGDSEDAEDGAWSLKAFARSGRDGIKYTETKFASKGQWERTYEPINRKILMLQSCFRVSYTSPKAMRWITELLAALMEDKDLASSAAFVDTTEKYAKEAIRSFLVVGDFARGVDTPHIVLNYLDYLLWQQGQAQKPTAYDDFAFEFRSSIEHWYPRNPSEENFERWEEVDRFGNLCLMHRNINSKFSNLGPMAKLKNNATTISKGSLKLRKMKDCTQSDDGWKEAACAHHEKEMLDLLREACGSMIEG